MTIQHTIETKLRRLFSPHFMEVINESHMHAVPANSETHFKVVLVSDQFHSQRLVQRHQAIYSVLEAELNSGVHALALHTFTAEEWLRRQSHVQASPECMGAN